MIDDENNVLTDDKLVIVRGLLKESKHACLYIRNERPVNLKYFDCYKQKLQKKRKKIITQEKHPGRVAQGRKLAALMKKRKERILRNK